MNKMNDPFFSIIIPTRNRPDYVRDCVASVLKQTYKNFEIIVSDNGTTKLCKEVIEKFDDSRIIYKHPESELGPCDNFEFAQEGFRGEYFITLGDKHRLHRNALERVYEAIKKHNTDIISFYGEVFTVFDNGEEKDIKAGYLKKEKYSYQIYKLDTWSVIEEKMRFEDPFGFEKGLIYGNAFYSKELADKIRAVNGNGRLFDGVIADRYTSYVAMALVDEFTYIDEPLSIYIRNGSHTSDVAKSSINTLEKTWMISNRNFSIEDMKKFIPLTNCIALVKNIQAGDYLYAIYKLINSNQVADSIKLKYKNLKINRANYISGVIEELNTLSSDDNCFPIYSKDVSDYLEVLTEEEIEEVNIRKSECHNAGIRYLILNRFFSMVSAFLLAGTRKVPEWKCTICNIIDSKHKYVTNIVEYL